jgi:hypothetical protein
MRFLPTFALVAVAGLALACGGSSSSDSSDDSQGALEHGQEATQSNRQITGKIDADAGQASIVIKSSLVRADLAAVKAKLADPSLAFFAGLKRPTEFKVGSESIKVGSPGGKLLNDLEADGSSVTATMKFAESGLGQYGALKVALDTKADDTADGLVITASNPEKLETALLGLDVVPANKLSLKISAKKAASGGVDVIVEMSVTILHQEAKVGKLLGAAVAVADGLEAAFPNAGTHFPPGAMGMPILPPRQ